MEVLQQKLRAVVKELFNVDIDPTLTRPDEQFGDYATNVAMQLAKQVGKNPREVAESVVAKLDDPMVAKAEVAGPGFINIWLTDEALWNAAGQKIRQSLKGQNIIFEYSDPNPFKILHAGHLYQTVIGDSMTILLEAAGAEVHRVNFGGDVGLHVAKTMWAVVRQLDGEQPQKLSEIQNEERAEWLAQRYIEGSNAYEDDEDAKKIIIEMNRRVYELHSNNDHDSPFAKIYWTTRQWSYDYFDEFYAKIGSGFEKYYPESETAPLGLKTVQEQLEKGVYEKSDGAVVFKAEKYGLHTRVFINSQGLPTYEAKDVGLIMAKQRDYPSFSRTIIITGNDIIEYMKVVLKSIEQFAPDLVQKTTHLTHGQVKMKGGVKMSSRKGNIFRAQDVLDSAVEASKKINDKVDNDVVLGAVKYAFLKQGLGPDVIYDPEESVAIQGNSGPYLQYAHARAQSILTKAEASESTVENLEADERSLVRKISEYPEVVEQAINELSPHHICTYLYELGQTFNRFYEKNRIIGDDREAVRLQLVKAYAQILKDGLKLLNITAPERM